MCTCMCYIPYVGAKTDGSRGDLTGLLPNLQGPNVICRKLYWESYGQWHCTVLEDTLTRRNITMPRKPHSAMAVRVIRGYRKVSIGAACVLAGSSLWELDTRALASLYFWRKEEQE